MPTLVYFGLQGRAQAIRFMLAHKGVAFEDKRLTFEEWGPMKAAGTYGDCQLPVWVSDDGSYRNQSTAILKSLAMEHGLYPTDAATLYECEWALDTFGDVFKSGSQLCTIKPDATDEMKNQFIADCAAAVDKFEARWADGRAHAAGSQVTYFDFSILTMLTSFLDNPAHMHASVREANLAKIAQCPNFMRVANAIKEICADQVAALAPGPL